MNPKSKPKSLLRRVLGYLVKGFLVMLPILGTVAILTTLWGMFDSLLAGPLKLVLRGRYYPGMGAGLMLLIILFVGIFLNTWIVRSVLNWASEAFDRIPMVKSIYGSIRDLMGFFASKHGKRASQVVMVSLGNPLGGPAPQFLGLLTREEFSDLPEGFVQSPDMVAVYVPLSYAMGGITTLVPRSAVRPINMSMEEAMRFAITAGMAVKPPAPPNGEGPDSDIASAAPASLPPKPGETLK